MSNYYKNINNTHMINNTLPPLRPPGPEGQPLGQAQIEVNLANCENKLFCFR